MSKHGFRLYIILFVKHYLEQATFVQMSLELLQATGNIDLCLFRKYHVTYDVLHHRVVGTKSGGN